MSNSRFIRARVVGAVEFAGESAHASVAGPRRKNTPKQRQIRAKLRRARFLKKRIAHLRIRKPLGWKGAVRQAKTNLRVVMSDLKMLGWKPKKPRRALRPGEDEMDAALDEIPEREADEPEDEEVDELPESPEAEPFEGEANWLDGYVGVEPAAKPKKPKKKFFEEAGKLFAPKWSKPVPLGSGGQIQTRPGQRAMVATVSPGLFIVQLVSDDAAKRIAGDNVGVLPLLLYPLVKDKIQNAMAPKPAPSAQPAPASPPAAQPAAAPAARGDVGCDCTPKRS
jgi:hypothetical protein